MVEVKADALEESFAQFEEEDGVAALKVELETLKAKIASGVIAAQRPALDGVKSAEASSFVDQYLRRGIESGLETKAIGSSSRSSSVSLSTGSCIWCPSSPFHSHAAT